MLAVPTTYDGVLYRSRTEAEWAAVLTAHAVRYQYEPITFLFDLVAPAHWRFTAGYLPDFWLPRHRLWLEVKPHAPNAIEYQKAALLAECTGTGVLITTGGPSQSEAMALVTALDAVEVVSTLPGGSHPQAPLKFDINLLSHAQTVHTGAQIFNSALVGAIEACNAAFCDAWELNNSSPEPRRKRVLFLPPDADYLANCFCSEKWPGECRRCSTVVRTFVTDETAAKLRSVKRKAS